MRLALAEGLQELDLVVHVMWRWISFPDTRPDRARPIRREQSRGTLCRQPNPKQRKAQRADDTGKLLLFASSAFES